MLDTRRLKFQAGLVEVEVVYYNKSGVGEGYFFIKKALDIQGKL